ncbi:MAG: Crp/Fnr family transcriptional regulator [Pseudobdellovibrionaceae bacterium]
MALLSANDIVKISEFELFRGIPGNTLKSCLSGASVRTLKHREFLCQAGDLAESFYIVLEGAVKLLRHSPKGEDIIVHFAVQGDVIGALLMNENKNGRFPISSKSMGVSRVVCVPRSTFLSYWKENVQIQSQLHSLLYRRMSNIQDDKTLISSPLKVRIANLLLRHLDQTAETPNQSLMITLTRQEIADSLGVAVESVIRTMKEFHLDGVISRADEKSPEIINIQKLLTYIE